MVLHVGLNDIQHGAKPVSYTHLYFSLHKPKRTVVIYRDESDLRKLEEIRFFADRWSIERTVQWDEENVHDLPYGKETLGSRSFEGIQKLMRIMDDYDAVFVSGVSATLRNGIVKYCVEKNKACLLYTSPARWKGRRPSARTNTWSSTPTKRL